MDSLSASMEASKLADAAVTTMTSVGGDAPPDDAAEPTVKARPLPRSLPTAIARSYLVQDIPTDAWIQLFEDRIILGLSQKDTHVGTFLSCDVEQSILDYDKSKARYNVTALLGGQRPQDQVLHVLCRRVTEEIASLRGGLPCPPVLLCISLLEHGTTKGEGRPKDLSQEMFNVLDNLLVDLYKEAIQAQLSP